MFGETSSSSAYILRLRRKDYSLKDWQWEPIGEECCGRVLDGAVSGMGDAGDDEVIIEFDDIGDKRFFVGMMECFRFRD